MTTWTVWRTVEIGTCQDAISMKDAIGVAGMFISRWAEDILRKVSFARTKQTLDLVILTPEELGFPVGGTLKLSEIFDVAKEQGLSLCPAEVGSQLRLQYKDQPRGEWNFVAMEPILDSDGDPRLFYVGHGGAGRWLYGYFAGSDGGWGGFLRFVFVLGK